MAGEMLCGACVVRVFVSVGLCGAGRVLRRDRSECEESRGVLFGGRCTNVWPRMAAGPHYGLNGVWGLRI